MIPAVPIAAQQRRPTSREPSFTEVVKASSPAVVLVVTSDASGNPVSQGSGFIVSADGRVATNYHVIEGADSAIVKISNGAVFPVEGVLAQSESDDLAVLKVSGSGLPLLHLGEAKSVSSGDKVIAIGSPLGLEGTVTDGIVSAIREEKETKTPLIQTTAAVSHGSSGGPLLDLEGRVVGILTFKFSSGENLNFAVAVNALKVLLAEAHAPTPLANQRKVGAVREEDKLKHWIGLWVFAGPVKMSIGGQGLSSHALDVHNFDPLSVLTIAPSGQVTARVIHPERRASTAEDIRNPKPDWSGTATETTLVLTMDPIPPGELASAGVKDAAGRLEAHREGDHYSVDFTYFYAWDSPDGEREAKWRFWGEMKRP